MSREEIVERLRRAIYGVLNCWDVNEEAQRVIVRTALIPEIERLLAEERHDMLGELLAFNSQLGCTPQEGYKDLTDALRDTKHLIARAQRDERDATIEECAQACDDWSDEQTVRGLKKKAREPLKKS